MTFYMLSEREALGRYIRVDLPQVWKVLFKKNKKFYALKEMSKAKIVEKKSQNSVKYERELLSKIRHPYHKLYIIQVHCQYDLRLPRPGESLSSNGLTDWR